MKYKHFHPPGTSFCSTYTEILTFSLSRGNFDYTYNEISTFSQSKRRVLLYVKWNINILGLGLRLHVGAGKCRKTVDQKTLEITIRNYTDAKVEFFFTIRISNHKHSAKSRSRIPGPVKSIPKHRFHYIRKHLGDLCASRIADFTIYVAFGRFLCLQNHRFHYIRSIWMIVR